MQINFRNVLGWMPCYYEIGVGFIIPQYEEKADDIKAMLFLQDTSWHTEAWHKLSKQDSAYR